MRSSQKQMDLWSVKAGTVVELVCPEPTRESHDPLQKGARRDHSGQQRVTKTRRCGRLLRRRIWAPAAFIAGDSGPFILGLATLFLEKTRWGRRPDSSREYIPDDENPAAIG